MRIAQVAPLWEPVPPRGYGGIELIVSLLTDELVRRGHEVTLFASGDSKTDAKLETAVSKAFRLSDEPQDTQICELLQMSHLLDQIDQFDLVHSHTMLPSFHLADLVKVPVVYTLHGNFTPQNIPLFQRYSHLRFISISDDQRHLLDNLNYVATVYNGINADNYPFFPTAQTPPYLAFLGRMSPQKGPHHAIEIAKQTGWTLKMAGKIDPVDQNFFVTQVEPLIDGQQIQYLGEVNHAEKLELLGNAAATLFPITWQEPFGLVMIESMCVGTPVLGMALGSVPEVIEHGRSGFICNSVDEMIQSLPQVTQLSRQACHDHVVRAFSVNRMVDDYVAAYEKILAEGSTQNGHRPLAAITV
jgi:glycosyltransferase involved in cell wall biosynthesis